MADDIFTAVDEYFDQVRFHKDIQFMARQAFRCAGRQGRTFDIPENAAPVGLYIPLFDPYPVSADIEAFSFGKRCPDPAGKGGRSGGIF